jgi:ribosome-associated heat shock protein Hsp15
MSDRDEQSLRIDRWLWFTRFYKTRGLASAAVTGGHVRVNGERAKPGSKIREGDVIELVRGQLPFRLEAGRLPVRRGPASEARLCYVEDDATQQKRQAILDAIRRDRQQMPRTRGRPDKHTQRKIRKHTQRKIRQFGRRTGESDSGKDH